MRFPGPPSRSVSFYHLPATAGQKQPYPAAADLVIDCAVLPLDRKNHALEGFDLIDPQELYADPGADIRLNDKVKVSGDGADFFVKHVFMANFGSLRHQRVTVAKSR